MSDQIDKLRKIIGNIPIRKVEIPEEQNLNNIYIAQGENGILQLLDMPTEMEEVTEVERTPLPVLLNDSLAEIQDIETAQQKFHEDKNIEKQEEKSPQIETVHEGKLRMKAENNIYYVLGTLSQDLSSMRITLMVEERHTGRKERTKLDLYEREIVKVVSIQFGELYNQSPEQIEADLLLLTDLLEQYREKQLQESKPGFREKRIQAAITPENQKKAVEFLRQPGLLQNIDNLIEQAGVVGEENTRKLLFVIASTYKMNYPLHALVQGTSGSGKSHLINTIGQCFPPEDVMSMTRVTSKSFYHYSHEELVNKLILIQDYDGLDEEAQYAFRELQSAGTVSSSTTYKDRFGNLTSTVKTVKSHFSSLLATTKAEVYYDNMSRSVILGVDESDRQTQKIIEHQNSKLAGISDYREERKAAEFLQNCIRCIKPMEVVNPYADKVRLPIEAKMLRRLNNHYQAFVKQITILHQYQRNKDNQGRIIAEPEDLKIACDILFDAIMLKVDDLDSSLRQFFDRMKAHVRHIAQGKPTEYQFTQRDIRLALNASKATCFRYMEDLELLEYIQRTGGYANRGFKYKIVFWDDMEKIRIKVKAQLNAQLETLNQPAVHSSSNPMNHQNPHEHGENSTAVQQFKSMHSNSNQTPS